MIDPEAPFEHWPMYEEITEKYYRQRYFYGEVQGDRLRAGRIVRWYRTANVIMGPTPIQPIVRFHDPEGAEGEAEYVELGATEKYWIGAAVEDLRDAWQRARSAGGFPQRHGERLRHAAEPFCVDPAHFLLVYGELRDRDLVFGRVVGWDPPKFSDELPCPMVRLYQDDGSLEPFPICVGIEHEPDHYWIGRSSQHVRTMVKEWQTAMAAHAAKRAQERAARPSRDLAEVVPVWDQVIESASRNLGPHVTELGRQASLTAVEHDTLVVTMPSRELGQKMVYQRDSFRLALHDVLGGDWEVRVLLADGDW